MTLTLGASGNEYVAPASGYFCAKGITAGTANSTCGFKHINGSLWEKTMGDGQTAMWFGLSIPVGKNQSVYFDYYNITINSLEFIYDEGSQPVNN